MARTVQPHPTPATQQLSDAKVLGAFVRAHRTQAGMTIHEAAAYCGVSVSAMSNIETGTGDVRLSSILKICSLMGVIITIGVKEQP